MAVTAGGAPDSSIVYAPAASFLLCLSLSDWGVEDVLPITKEWDSQRKKKNQYR